VVKQTGCKQRPKPLTDKHSRQSNKTKEWWRRRRQFYQAKNNTDGETSPKGEQHRTQRNDLGVHSGSPMALLNTPVARVLNPPGLESRRHTGEFLKGPDHNGEIFFLLPGPGLCDDVRLPRRSSASEYGTDIGLLGNGPRSIPS
jgi:hypothetical protein